jgi:phosphate transport system permease protein
MSASIQQVAPERAGQEPDRSRLMRRLHLRNTLGLATIWIVSILVFVMFIAIIVNLLIQGFLYKTGGLPLILTPSFYSSNQQYGIGAELFNTLYILILSELFLFPIALGAALFTVEYAPQGWFISAIRFAAETLAGVPSLVLGLFGFLIFTELFHMGVTRLSGALTLLCLNFPQALRLFEDALSSVPKEVREGSLALGCSKWHMIRTVVLPSALPGLITGLILTAGKIVGETAALIFTMGINNPIGGNVFTLNPMIQSDNLTIHMWSLKTQDLPSYLTPDQASAIAAASATVLIVVLLILNVSARAIGRAVQRRVMAS